MDGKVVDLRTVLAEAVKNLFPDAKFTIGSSIDTGFYYDFDHSPFSREDLDALEAEMKKIIKKGAKARVPYMLIVGEKEAADGLVSVRSRFAGDEGQKPLADFLAQICEEIRTKEIRKEEVQE